MTWFESLMKIEMTALEVSVWTTEYEWTFLVLRISAIFLELKKAWGIDILIDCTKTI